MTLKGVKPSCLVKGCLIPALLLFVFCLVINIVVIALPLMNAYGKWESGKPQNYSVLVTYGTYAGPYNSSREVIRYRALLSSTATGFTDPAIDRLFDSIRTCALFPLGFLICRAEYDSIYGYPVRIIWEDLDLGRITEVSDFKPE